MVSLKDNGLFLLHCIGSKIPVHETDSWIPEYIFNVTGSGGDACVTALCGYIRTDLVFHKINVVFINIV